MVHMGGKRKRKKQKGQTATHRCMQTHKHTWEHKENNFPGYNSQEKKTGLDSCRYHQ